MNLIDDIINSNKSDVEIDFIIKKDNKEVENKDVFEKYQKQALTDPSDCGGTRLGLALSLAIVQRHGGLVDAFSLDSEKKQYKFVMQVPVMRVSESSSRLDLEGVA